MMVDDESNDIGDWRWWMMMIMNCYVNDIWWCKMVMVDWWRWMVHNYDDHDDEQWGWWGDDGRSDDGWW